MNANLHPDLLFQQVLSEQANDVVRFRSEYSSRALLYPILDFRLPENLAQVIAKISGTRCYLYFVGVSPDARTRDLATAEVDLSDYARYATVSHRPYAQALVALDGSWGAYLDEELFGLIGGRSGFVESLEQTAPSLAFAEQTRRFVSEYETELGPGTWASQLLDHVGARNDSAESRYST